MTEEQSAAPPQLASILRARGMRHTPQREQVLAAVRRLGHATPEQVSEAVTGVDVTTVYRTLELLEELGLVRHTHLDHGPPAYRPSDDQHIHVVCHVCGRVVDAEPGVVDDLERRLHETSGFHVDRAHFTVFGRCRDCADHPHEHTHDRADEDGGHQHGRQHREHHTAAGR